MAIRNFLIKRTGLRFSPLAHVFAPSLFLCLRIQLRKPGYIHPTGMDMCRSYTSHYVCDCMRLALIPDRSPAPLLLRGTGDAGGQAARRTPGMEKTQNPGAARSGKWKHVGENGRNNLPRSQIARAGPLRPATNPDPAVFNDG
jgi:hypothetical protein